MKKALTLIVAAVVLFAALVLLTRPRQADPVPKQKQMAKQAIEPRSVPQEHAAPQLTPQPEPPAEEKAEEPITHPPGLGWGRCALYGTVTDPEGDPAGGVEAVIVRTKEGTSKIPVRDMPIGETMTLHDGSYRLENLPDGHYVVCAIALQGCGSGAGFLDWDTETRREVRLDIQMKPPIATSGTVWNAGGEPVEGASITVLGGVRHAPVMSKLMPVMAEEGGRYTLTYLWKGGYTIESSAEGYAPSVLQGVEAGTSGNDFVLYAGGSVSGTVRFKDTGERACGIRVVAQRLGEGSDRETVTDDNGTYLLDRLSPEANYAITVESEDYVALEVPVVALKDREVPPEVEILFPVVFLEDGELATGVDILLSTGGSISGTVTVSETGEPLSGAKVYVRGESSSRVSREATSGMDGAYSCVLLPAGRYRVGCQPPPGVVRGRSVGEGIVVSVAPEESVTDVDFSFIQGASISGRVTDSNMNGIEGAKLLAQSWSGEEQKSVSHARSDMEGNYRLTGIRRSSPYRVFANAKGYTLVYREIRTPREGEAVGIDFVLEDGATISGRVVDAKGYPLSDAELHLVKGPGERQLLPDPTRSDEDGRFETGDLAAGSYRFRVEVHSADRGYSQMAKNDPITVRAGETITDVEIVVEAAEEHAIEGYARNERGEGVPGVTVEASSEHLGGRAETDVSGHYRLEGLDDGTVGLTFRHRSYATARLRDVRVGTLDADVVMPSKGSISGVVMDAATQRPLDLFDVAVTRLQFHDGTEDPLGLSFGVRRRGPGVGEFSIEGMAPGVATLRASASGYAPQEISDIVVESGQLTAGVEFYLSVSAVIEGYVTQHGRPVTRYARISATAVAEPAKTAGTSRTDENGFYRIDALPGDSYTVLVEIDSDRRRGRTMGSAEVEVKPGQTARVDFELGGTSAVRGMVSPMEGYNVTGVIVCPASATEPFSFENWQSIQSQVLGWTECEPDGSYEIADLPAGSYNVTAVWAPRWESPGEDIRQTSRIVTVEERQVVELSFAL